MHFRKCREGSGKLGCLFVSGNCRVRQSDNQPITGNEAGVWWCEQHGGLCLSGHYQVLENPPRYYRYFTGNTSGKITAVNYRPRHTAGGGSE